MALLQLRLVPEPFQRGAILVLKNVGYAPCLGSTFKFVPKRFAERPYAVDPVRQLRHLHEIDVEEV